MIIKVFDGYESKYKGTEVDAAVGRAQKAVTLDGDNIFTGDNDFRGNVILGDKAIVDTPPSDEDVHKVINIQYLQNQGYLNSLTADMITTALGYTPQDIANIVTTLSAESTDVQYPSAKAVYDITSANIAAINTINGKIPEAATSTNQLADKDFVNSSIATSTATFRGTFNSLADLEAYSGPKDDNDYAFVITKDSVGNTLYNRYKYTGNEWLFEYSLNNSSFTAVQWAAINSNITSARVIQIATNTSAISELQVSKQNVIVDLEAIREGALSGATALQPGDNISKLNNDTGFITGITSNMVTAALGYTPYDSSNPDGYMTSISSTDVTTALGYTPYNSTNPAGYQANVIETIQVNNTTLTPANKTVNITVPTDTSDLTNGAGYITTISSTDVTTALGYTPYDSSNPSGFITGITSNMVTAALGYTPYNGATNPSNFTKKFSTVNPALTSSSNLCTWSIANSIGSKKVQVNIYEVSTGKEILFDALLSDSTISVEFFSPDNIAPGTYEAIIIG